MKRHLNTIIIVAILFMVISAGVFASGQINLFINGKEVKSDVSPKITNGRVLVPIRVISEELGAEVTWDDKKQTVQINSHEDIWKDSANHWVGGIDDAVCVVSEFLAFLQSAVRGGDSLYQNYSNVFSQSVINSPEPYMRVWHPAFSGQTGSSARRLAYKMVDGREVLDKDGNFDYYEIAARLRYYDRVSGPTYTEYIKVYKVIKEKYNDQGTNDPPNRVHWVIDDERTIKEVNLDPAEMPGFFD
ncbi:MAG: copper amine oxidase N-terminal domain-containing protein [Desulfitobacteriaceae bacterium]|nr:copper amine oxidase N-terminal domain-containing protein [Desulfitobacteriaceae bacterium]